MSYDLRIGVIEGRSLTSIGLTPDYAVSDPLVESKEEYSGDRGTSTFTDRAGLAGRRAARASVTCHCCEVLLFSIGRWTSQYMLN